MVELVSEMMKYRSIGLISLAILILLVPTLKGGSAEDATILYDSIDVNVRVENHYAITDVSKTLSNGGDQMDEVVHYFRIPEGAFLSNLSLLVDGSTFYADVVEPSAEEKAGWDRLPHSDEEFRKMVGAPALHGEEGRTTLERLWSRPSLDVNGVWGGFTGEGSMTVLPARASAKVSMRLVPNQDPEDIFRKIRAHVERSLPEAVVLEAFRDLHGAIPWTSSLEHPAIQILMNGYVRSVGTTFSRITR